MEDLHIQFQTSRGIAKAVNGVSFTLEAGEAIALVGESGSGKSVSALSLMRLVPPPGVITNGHIYLHGRDLLQLSDQEMRQVRGKEIAMVFQNPMTSLNPSLTIGRQIGEALRRSGELDSKSVKSRAVELLDLVGIPSALDRINEYPHRFSGGMRQRAMIAMALASDPKVLVADEPTTALDVTIQAQIVDLVSRLQREFEMAVIWITHDLGLVAGMARRVLVMYGGSIVEEALVDDLYERPAHPYTIGLLGALPASKTSDDDLMAIPGSPPDPTDLPAGCPFWARCPYRVDPRCETDRPALQQIARGHWSASFYPPPERISTS